MTAAPVICYWNVLRPAILLLLQTRGTALPASDRPPQVAAKKLGLNATAMVMLQIVGGAAGQVGAAWAGPYAFVEGHAWMAAALDGGCTCGLLFAQLLSAEPVVASGRRCHLPLAFGKPQAASNPATHPAAPLQMISISNILGGRAVMGMQHIPEGQFVRAALPACLAYYIAGTALALPFLFAG